MHYYYYFSWKDGVSNTINEQPRSLIKLYIREAIREVSRVPAELAAVVLLPNRHRSSCRGFARASSI